MKYFNLRYSFPYDDPSVFSVFQNQNSKIMGFKIRRNDKVLKEISNEFIEVNNYGIYFLLDNNETTQTIYIGQSTDGLKRIKQHDSTKMFWSECILFVTENNNWDKTTIDYLEHKFINHFTDSKYVLENKVERSKVPNVNRFDLADLENAFEEIKKLLSCNNIIGNTNDNKKKEKLYKAIRGYKASLYFENGKFVLSKGSEVKKPSNSSSDRADIQIQQIDDLIESGKVIENEGKFTLKSEITMGSVSAAAKLVSGYSVNGWSFWEGIEELR